jgi:hypothetical protein
LLQIWASADGERGEREHLGLRVVHQGADLREPAGGGRVGLNDDGAEHGGDHVGVRLGHVCQQIPGDVHPASLVPGALEAAFAGGHETGVLVGDDQPHP